MAINLGTIFAQIGLDTSLLRAGVSKANVQLAKAEKGFGGFIKRNEKAMLRFGVAGVAAVGAIAIASIKMAGDFDQAMRNVNTITKLSEKQLNELKEEVIDLSKEVPLTTQELTDGLFNVASAGVEAANQMNFLASAARAATAGQADLGTTVKGLTGVIKGYGDSFENVDKVADLFFKTNELGVTTFEELASSMGKVVPIAASLGVTQEELFASMATLTGVTGNTSEVVTQLKAAFSNIIKPTADAQKIVDDLGISFDATSIQTLGLAGFLDQVKEATGGNVETMGKLFGGVEGLGAVLALTGSSSEKFTKNLDAMENAAGAATDAFSEQQKGLNNQLKILKNNVNAIALDIGGKILPKLTEFTTRINELDDETKDNISTTAEWTLATVGVTSAVSLLLVGGKRLLAFLGPWGKAIAAVVAITTTHFKITEKLSSLIDNQWAKSIVKSSSLIGSLANSTDTWSAATKFAEDNNKSLLSVLFMKRSELELLNNETEEAADTTGVFTVSLQEEKVAMQQSAAGLRIRTERQEEANIATEQGATDTDNLNSATFNLWETLNLLSGGLKQQESAFSAFKQSLDNIAGSASELAKKLKAVGEALGNIPNSITKQVNIKTNTVFTGTTGAGTPIITTPKVDVIKVTNPVNTFSGVTGLGVPTFAEGGVTPFSGQFLVGEKGPEIARFPQGTQITANNQVSQELAGGDREIVIPVTVQLDGAVLFESIERVGNEEEFRRID